MDFANYTSDAAILQELGRRLARRRLDLQLTQADLAEQAGIGKRTVERVEAGEATQSVNLIRVFRLLGLLPGLSGLLPEQDLSPFDFLKLKGKERRRASSKKTNRKPDGNWSWGDEG